MTITAKQTLIAAREVIADPAHWTKGALAADEHGRETGIDGACKFCMLGALDKAVQMLGAQDAIQASAEAENRIYALIPGAIVDFNDDPGTRHEDVLRIFDTAIANLP